MTSIASTQEPGSGKDGGTSVDTTYVSQFSKHLDHVRAHLSGQDRSGRLPPSFLPPGAYWTSADKDVFFHALAIHSRLRPDLIAEEIKTKSVMDVRLYIQLLESSAHTDGPMLRKDFQIATRVSDALIALEEEKAQPILAAEPRWESRELEEARQVDMETREKAVRARKGEAQSEGNEHYRQDVKRRKKEFKQWVKERKEEWKVEDTLRALDCAALKAIDRVLREEDEANLQAEGSADAHNDADEKEPEPQLNLRDASLMSEQRPEVLVALSSDEEMIDPLLRNQAQEVSDAAANANAAATSTPSLPIHHPTVPLHILSHHQFRPRTPPFRIASLPPTSSEPISRASSVAAVPGFEPGPATAARRKLQKRLHMRKKRAEARGGSVVSTASRLKPGRKRADKVLRGSTAYAKPTSRNMRYASSDDGASDPGPESISGEPGEGHHRQSLAHSQNEHTRRPCPSGQTLPYRLLNKLREIGLDADKLQEEYVGVMSLKGLAKLMKLYNRLHDVDPTTSSQISSDVIKLLNAHVLHFTVELMHRVIVMREQERESKRHTKGWRMGKFDRVSHVHVEQALSLLGCKSVTKKEHFDGLLQRLGLMEDDFDDAPAQRDEIGGSSSSEDEADDECEVHEGGQEESDDDDEGAFDHLMFPLHRVIVPPTVHFAAAQSSPPTSGVPRSLDASLYMPWPASTPAGLSLEGELMSEETDTDALVEEMLDEEQLDEHDQIMEEAYEESLWAELGASPPPEAQPRPRRKRKRYLDDDSEED